MRILIVTLFYEPLNNIAATRLTNFTKYLRKLGHDVDVITRHYTKEDLAGSNLSVAMNAGDDIDDLYYKANGNIYTKYSVTNSKKSISNKLPPGVKGLYNLYHMDVYQYNFVENGLFAYEKEFGNNCHDIIIASSPPPAALLLAKELSSKYNIPWIADFRDSYIATEDRKIIQKIKSKTLNRVLKTSAGILFVSEGMKTQNLEVFSKSNKVIPSTIIYNGFEVDLSKINEDVIDKFNEIKDKHNKVLVYTGSLYPERNLDFFLEGMRRANDKQVILVIVGVQEEFKREIETNFSDVNFVFFDKVTYSTAIKIQSLADYLLLTIWKDNYTGFSGKVFEYLYSENNIILDYKAPDDLKEYLGDFMNIHYCDESFDNFKSIMNKKNEKEINIIDVKEKLSREHQVENLHAFLKRYAK